MYTIFYSVDKSLVSDKIMSQPAKVCLQLDKYFETIEGAEEYLNANKDVYRGHKYLILPVTIVDLS